MIWSTRTPDRLATTGRKRNGVSSDGYPLRAPYLPDAESPLLAEEQMPAVDMLKSKSVWKDISPVTEGGRMKERSTRFLAFIDYLGTRELYKSPAANAARIEERRYELEHAIQIKLQRLIAQKKIEIGIFSDTVLIAGANLADVLSGTVSLLGLVLRKTLERDDPNDIRLLRGGISEGIELRSGYLPSTPGVHVIPFYDGSLAFAYELEGIRRGSRLFISRDLAKHLGTYEKYRFDWEYMPGFGKPAEGVHEILWPAVAHGGDPNGLSELLHDCFEFWRSALGENASIGPDEYRATLYHVDETLKCIIRSFVCVGDNPSVAALLRLLPTPGDRMAECNIRFAWGIWFQVVLVLCKLGVGGRYLPQIRFALGELRHRDYYDKFMAETEYPDYQIMRPLIKEALRTSEEISQNDPTP